MSKIPNDLPIPKRIVTRHDESGSATFDVLNNVDRHVDNVADFHFIWKTQSFPSDLTAVPEEEKEEALSSKGGSVCRICDIAPNSRSAMHRTVSLDYGFMIAGSLTLEVDDGKEIDLNPGDVVVQRGTIHSWVNKTDQWARMSFVLLDAHAPTVNGKMLEPAYIH